MKLTHKQIIGFEVYNNESHDRIHQSILDNAIDNFKDKISTKTVVTSTPNRETKTVEYNLSTAVLSPSEYQYLLDVEKKYEKLKKLLMEEI